ncbi:MULTISPECIES: ABC transporter permease [Sporosarcina]|uniref:ABC transporter permease n=1 Tax=Sporosarcina TaxID=1569 RepID=UPI00058F9C53|nr:MULTISPECIES: ABC transporter permease subunit [Sporosarcina]WJY28886.1 ABC transporter permease subunit [Sporosarcina sp. 0.2-SM1T-5]
MRAQFNNPVLAKEVKLRFRSAKSFTGILIYLAAMCLFVFGFIYTTTSLSGTIYFKPSESVVLFMFLTFIQLGLVLFITPGLTAGTISGERERQTLPMLLTTSQSSFQIISGKLLSSVLFLLLLIVAGLPVYSMVFLFGGISPVLLLKSLLFLFITLLSLGSLGVLFSTLIRRTTVSMIVTYGSMLFFTAVIPFLFLIIVQVKQMAALGSGTAGKSVAGFFLAAINPEIFFASLLAPEVGGMVEEVTQVQFPMWIVYVLFYGLIAVLSIWLATKRLRVNMKKPK